MKHPTAMTTKIYQMPNTPSSDTNSATTPSNGTSNGVSAPHQNPRQARKGFLQAFKSFIQQKKYDENLRDAIDELITDSNNSKDDPSTGVIAEHERTLINNVLDLRDMPVVDVMVPRADIIAIDVNSSFDDLTTVLLEKPHSRLPVYEDELDNVIGSVHMKDAIRLLRDQNHSDLRSIMRDVLVVSPSMRVMDLLLQMRQSRLHLAMVVDEFGGIDGLITINDLIESIVGEIEDEHNFEVQPQLIERVDGTIILDARYEMEDFQDRFGKDIFDEQETDEVDTMGGFVNTLAGHLPARGEVITHDNGTEFEILDADPRRINRIRIRNLPQSDTESSAE